MVISLLAVASGLVMAEAAPAHAAYNCSCVQYVRARTGLSGGLGQAADYTESQMAARGYRRVNPTPGAIMVFDRYQKGAGGYGHMAMVNSARYNYSTRQWEISLQHVNWADIPDRCSVHGTYFRWGNLYGVNSYVRR